MSVRNITRKWSIFLLWPLFTLEASAQPASPVVGNVTVPTARSVETFPLQLSTDQTTILIFPAAIKSVDKGHGQILSRTVREATNVLKLKSASDSLPPTNLSVFTADGRIYPFSVSYQLLPADLVLDFSGQSLPGSWRPVQLTGAALNDADIQLYSQVVADLPGYQKRPHSNRIGGMRMRVNGKYVQQGILFFPFTIENRSRLPFYIDFARCYIRDNRQSRRSTSMEKEIQPLFIHVAGGDSIRPRSTTRLVMAFEQFTIADNKHFSIELFERGGDRNLRTRMRGKHILKIKPLLPFLMGKYPSAR